MLPPLIRRTRKNVRPCTRQRGFTMAFVAITMVAIISMAALSIDIGTLYEAKAEAQRAADAAALAGAQVISTSGITGDPTNGPTDGSWSASLWRGRSGYLGGYECGESKSDRRECTFQSYGELRDQRWCTGRSRIAPAWERLSQ